jgi:amino acid adenylation domain-containing protein
MTGSFTPFETSATGQSIPSRFEQQAEKYADQLAIRGRRDLTYAQLNSFANALAREILEVSPRTAGSFEPIAVLLPSGGEAIAALLGTLKAGKIHVSLDATFPRDRIAAQFADSQARVVVTTPAHRALAESLSPARILVVEITHPISTCENPGLEIPPDAPAVLQYTSGSTGSPKGVLTPHCGLLHNAQSHANAGRLGAGDRFLPNRLLGSLNALLNGASVFPYAVKEDGLASLSGWLRENQITVMSAVPTTFRRFAAQLADDDRFPHLRLIKLTGEALYRRDVDLFQQRFPRGCFLQFSFAITETSAVAWRLIGHDVKADQDLVPVGLPVAGKEVLLLDDQRRPVSAGETGEIAVRSRYIAVGYWRQPELTEARFLTDPEDPGVRTYLTGDLGRIGPDGMLVHLGRKDSQVKIRANRVELAEVEAALRGVDGVRDAAVVARPDESGETCLAAYFVPSVTPAPPFGVVRRALAEKLPNYMVPATVTPLVQFPLLPNGKIDRRALPDPPRSPAARVPGSYTPPRTPMELLVAENWRAILHVERVGASDNFFDLGGSSLAAVESVTVLERKTGVRISPVSIASQTLAQVAAVYQERSPAPRPGLMAALRRFIGGRREP